jgi:hypothetical protein
MSPPDWALATTSEKRSLRPPDLQPPPRGEIHTGDEAPRFYRVRRLPKRSGDAQHPLSQPIRGARSCGYVCCEAWERPRAPQGSRPLHQAWLGWREMRDVGGEPSDGYLPASRIWSLHESMPLRNSFDLDSWVATVAAGAGAGEHFLAASRRNRDHPRERGQSVGCADPRGPAACAATVEALPVGKGRGRISGLSRGGGLVLPIGIRRG